MAFTALPRHVSAFAQSGHTDLVAVLGAYKRDMEIRVGITGDEMHYSTRLFGTLSQPPATDAVWRWGASADRICR